MKLGQHPTACDASSSVLVRTHGQHASAAIDLTVAERMFDLTDDDSIPANPRTAVRDPNILNSKNEDGDAVTESLENEVFLTARAKWSLITLCS